MKFKPSLLWRTLIWSLVSVMVILAITVTVLRVSLPRLDKYQSDIESWVSQTTGIEFQSDTVSGYWKNTHPFIALENLKAILPDEEKTQITIQHAEVELDLFASLRYLTPVVSTLRIDGLSLDISHIKWLKESGQAVGTPATENSSSEQVLKDIEHLLLRQLNDFSIANSSIAYQTFTGEFRTLEIEHLKWQNRNQRHRADGVIGIADENINSLTVKANFEETADLTRINGDFFVGAENLQVTPWLTQYLKDKVGILEGHASFNSWLSLKDGRPSNAYVELLPSEVSWNKESEHSLLIEHGIMNMMPAEKGWQVNAHSLKLRTDDTPWPELDAVFKFDANAWQLNVSEVDIVTLTPFTHLMPESEKLNDWLETVELGGRIEDIRVSMGESLSSLKFSGKLQDGAMKQWELLPEVHHLAADISGSLEQINARVSLIDDELPYGDVFQAPLRIRQAQVDVAWKNGENGWSLWADKVTAATPDMQVLGAFKLDVPDEGSSFLSIYAETDVFNAGETWRYLPTLALGTELTDYLSTAIQGGKASTSKLLWYGSLGQFPYQNNDGMFQALVNLKESQFSFDTAWPPLKNLQLDLLFQNDAMYLDSRSATLMDVNATRITGRIPELAEDGHIEIEAIANGEGDAVRDYMMATPLVDSVGAALTAVRVKGDVNADFRLKIPFDGSDTRAWGWARLPDNQVEIETPSMTLSNASGRIEFDNDVVRSSGLSADLLGQPVSLDFNGQTQGKNYAVGIDVVGDWDVQPLKAYVGETWLKRVQGHAPWTMDVDLQINDVGFTYQVDVNADAQFITSQYPEPLGKALGEKASARLQASGNQETISARLQLPEFKYQAEIDITEDMPKFDASRLVVGRGAFRVSPISGHSAVIRRDEFDLDQWLELFLGPVTGPQPLVSELDVPEIPVPDVVKVESKSLTLATVEWNDFNFDARRKRLGWKMEVESAEISGQASYLEPYDLTVSLDRLQLYIPGLEETDEPKPLALDDEKPQPLITPFDRAFHDAVPNLTLAINDFWLQGYKIGKVNVDFLRQGDRLEWKNISFSSGDNKFKASGWWRLNESDSRSKFTMSMSGKNNTEVMERFGITSGIQKAPFDMESDLEWSGAPWSPQMSTVNGRISSKLGKGIISDVSGAARLLGLFSLDSIIRKMQLDFSDVFDKGMAFNSITGSGEVKNGIFVTNDIEMDAVAGRMSIKGLANLETQTVDAEVEFVPDLTSGIPVLTAFAVAPQTAIYVFAITTALSPVVDVFTKVNYAVKGPLDNPNVTEISRSKGQYQVPDKAE
ncbi:YhdP family protein [Vibrio nigripulchritudo]|uniref:YhdP family protein n=1 Tax=Vibrio nigripulchritudo TaxID=28173 RepID=UPI00056E4CC7|nr:YhdP family protein [Vibrio nigripulchritudo]